MRITREGIMFSANKGLIVFEMYSMFHGYVSEYLSLLPVRSLSLLGYLPEIVENV